MGVQINPIYSHFFPVTGSSPNNWEGFKSSAQMEELIRPAAIDFSLSVATTWKSTVKKIALFILKIIIFPWALYEGLRYFIGKIVMRFVSPAQFHPIAHGDWLRQGIVARLNSRNRNYVVRNVFLEKNGVRFNGLLIGRISTISNGKWMLYATGNNALIEDVAYPTLTNDNIGGVNPYLRAGFNVLLINNPGVGRSEGKNDPEGIGDAQEMGISFLETAMRANKIVLAGHSLGGAAIGRAVLKHTFRTDIQYFVIRIATFDRLSHIVKKIAGVLGEKIILWLGYEMDSIAASRKLQDLHIHELVYQNARDRLMEGVTLMQALQDEGITENKTFQMVPWADHSDVPVEEISRKIQAWDQSEQFNTEGATNLTGT